MAKVLVLYHSSCGHIETMAGARRLGDNDLAMARSQGAHVARIAARLAV